MMWRSLSMLALLLAGACCQDMVTSIPPEEAGAATETPPLEKAQVKPTIRSLHITSHIKYRYATTLVSTRVVNPTNQSGEATFTVTLPESAFISQFLMEIKDKVYKAYVKEKEEAKAIYQEAVQAGHFAGHVALDARDSNQFTVSVNIEAHGKVTFNLTYEQLLMRNLGVYSNVININPQQIVEDMSVTVDVEEPTAIVNLEVPELQLSNEAIPDKHNEEAKIEEISPNHKQVTWAPTPDEQRSKNSSGLSGQFVVKYDVDRKENPQQILVDEGYFVHFFAPENLPKLRKHVIFVLDFSGSMSGGKLDQLKDAMKQIFSDLDPKDYFSIVIFQSWIEVWSPSGMYITSQPPYLDPWDSAKLEKQNKKLTLSNQFVVEATPLNIELARSFMGNYSDLGSTNIMGGLRTGLELVDIGEEMWANESDPPQPVVMFLTDGQPNVEEWDTNIIISKTKALNTKQCPIFSMAFGYGADYEFLRKLSLQNAGFARNIYEAADATLQLKNFYKTIASPLLSNVTFHYLPGQVDNSSNTKQEFPVFFSGSELVVAGRINEGDVAGDKAIGELRGISASGPEVYSIVVPYTMLKPKNKSTGHLEKAWSYLTIQQLLDKADSLDNGEEKNKTRKQALDLALQYAFVTPLTSLVVVKPNETDSSVDATKIKPGLEDPIGYGSGGAISGFPAAGFGGGGYAVPMAALPMNAMMARPMAAPAYTSWGGGIMSGYPSTPVAYPRRNSISLQNAPKTKIRQRVVGALRPSFRTQSSVLDPRRNSISLQNAPNTYHRRVVGALRPSFHAQSSVLVSSPLPPPPQDIPSPVSGLDSGSLDSLMKEEDEDMTSQAPQRPHKVPLEDIKWLQQALNATDKSVTVEGTQYKLGINETSSTYGGCQVANILGECLHLQYCALDVFQHDVSQFLPYKCHIPGLFLGVCCPKYLV